MHDICGRQYADSHQCARKSLGSLLDIVQGDVEGAGTAFSTHLKCDKDGPGNSDFVTGPCHSWMGSPVATASSNFARSSD